jgi:hypothetical protein
MSGSLDSLEILSAGTHSASTGKIVVAESDLDQIVEAFNALKESNIVKPHLKLGHTDSQKWFGQRDGIPSLGWITDVWKVGTKLLANVTSVPDALIDLIKQGRYHNVSAEVIWGRNVEHDGKSFSRVLTAVSLLGIEMPAVKDLAGLASALFTDKVPDSGETIELIEEPIMPEPKDKMGFSQEQVDSLIAAAVLKATDKVKAAFAVLTTRAEASEAEVGTLKLAAVTKESEDLVAQAIKDGKLLPKQKDIALSMLQVQGDKVKFGESELTPKEVFAKFLEAQGKVVDLSEQGSGDHKQTEFANPAQEVDYKVGEALKANTKLTYREAFDQVITADADLAQRYANSAS